ncbi:MAG: hypothetical protein EOO28_05280 [Comamonadaceae bacterium]|nr:MAG: hypothetical protein EOO28_05280 [Comamonadaceae bacterium]
MKPVSFFSLVQSRVRYGIATMRRGIRAGGLAVAASLVLAACGGGEDSPPASAAAPSTPALARDGVAAAAVPIVAAPASGDCGVNGKAATSPTLPNSQLDCAP